MGISTGISVGLAQVTGSVTYQKQSLAVAAAGVVHPMLSWVGRRACHLWRSAVGVAVRFLLQAVQNSPVAFPGVGGRRYQSDGRHHDDSHSEGEGKHDEPRRQRGLWAGCGHAQGNHRNQRNDKHQDANRLRIASVCHLPVGPSTSDLLSQSVSHGISGRPRRNGDSLSHNLNSVIALAPL